MMIGFKLFVILFFFTGISNCLIKDFKIKEACTSESLEFPCEFYINATYIILEINGEIFQGLNTNKMTFECNKDHEFAKHCSIQMNHSRHIGNTVYFRMDKPWLSLNQSMVQCFIRNNYNSKPNSPSDASKIYLHSCQELTPLPSVQPVSVTTPAATTSQAPNASCPVAKPSSDKYPTGLLVGMSSLGSAVGGAVLTALTAICCYIKCRRRDPVRNNEEQNGSTIPMQERSLNQKQTSEV